MQNIFTVFLPAAIVLFAFVKGGILWGVVALLLYTLGTILVKLPDIWMIQGSKKYAADPKKGLGYMEKAFRTGHLRVEYILYYGFMLLKSGDTEGAERVLDAAAHKKMTPETETRAAVNRSLLAFQKGDLKKAISILEVQLKNGKDKAVYGTLGQFLILDNQLQRALEVNEEAYRFDRFDESITDNLALTHRLLGDLEKSWELYEELTDKRLGIPVPYYNAGETLYAMGKKEEAVEMMQKALRYTFSSLAVVRPEEIEARIAEIEEELK